MVRDGSVAAQAIAVACALTLSAAGPAGASPYNLRGLQRFADPPLPAACGRDGNDAEAFIATDPKRPHQIAVSWTTATSGPFSGFDADDLVPVIARSRNGGNSWDVDVVPGHTPCQGGPYFLTIDHWTSVGPDGRTYVGAMGARHADNFLAPDILATTAGRDADAFPAMTVVEPGHFGAEGFRSRTSVTADPARPGVAHLLFSRIVADPDEIVVATTRDGGARWSELRSVVQTRTPNETLAAWQMLVLEDGTELVFYGVGRTSDGALPFGAPGPPPAAMVARRAPGASEWSTFIVTDEFEEYVLPRAAAGRDGSVYFAWGDIEGDEGRVRIARSTDGGLSWSDRDPAGQAFEASRFAGNRMAAAQIKPAIAVADDGTVGVTWYDLRDDKAPAEEPDPLEGCPSEGEWEGEITAHGRFAHSHDMGRTWSEQTLTGPFDLRCSGGNGDGALGAYGGLASMGNQFGAALLQGPPQAVEGPSDAYFGRLVRMDGD